MTDAAADIDAYCRRIGYAGPREPTMAVLQAILLAHATTIPFENIDVLLKRPIRLDLPALYEKLARGRRGGYCFEHNLLLCDVLRRLGFRAVGLAARVQWGRPAGAIGPRTHMLLRVDLAGESYFADVGFGGPAPAAPVPLRPQSGPGTPHEGFRLVPAGSEFDLETRIGAGWSSLYRISLQEQAMADFEVANWFTSTYPESLFVRNLIASRPARDRRCTLFNNKFTIRHRDGKVERRTLDGVAEFAEILADSFGVEPASPADVEAVAALAALAAERAAHSDPFESSPFENSPTENSR
jgi:N-hydroxyarylamine O-acetyltransferase